MHLRAFRRAAAAALTLLVLASLMAYADTVPVEGDFISPGVMDLGQAGPGDVLVRQVTFSLTCSGVTHATPGSTITLADDGGTMPGDGHAEMTDATINVPDNWAANGCTTPPQKQPASVPSTVTFTMPSTTGNDQEFTLAWSRAGSGGLTGMTTVTFRVDVIANTPPTLHLPADMLVEATSAAGAVVTFTATATDKEDTSPPTVTCTPKSGATFAITTTTVQCSAKDSGDLRATGSFDVTVRDSTGPVIAKVADVDITTDNPDGVAFNYNLPSVVDAVDPSPTVVCAPPSGDTFLVRTTTVTCTATDAKGNHSEMSFLVRVTYAPSVVWTTVWGEPVGASGATFVANPGRTVPVKVRIFANGVEQTTGSASLTMATCAGAAVGSMPMTWGGGRWNGSLDTSSLGGPGCYAVSASLDGQVAGSFQIDLRGADPGSNPGPKAKTKP